MLLPIQTGRISVSLFSSVSELFLMVFALGSMCSLAWTHEPCFWGSLSADNSPDISAQLSGLAGTAALQCHAV